MKKPATHEQFRTSGGFISLWLGNKAVSELELDDYLSNQFESDFGFSIYGPDAPEYSAEEVSRGVRELLVGFSVYTTFLEAAVDAAHRTGWTDATTAVVFYNFAYDRKFDRSTDESPIRFIGVVRYPGFE